MWMNQGLQVTIEERRRLIFDIAELVSQWGFARLFAECIDKLFFDPARSHLSIDEQCFEQVVSRFERYLRNINDKDTRSYGLIVHDNNETIARKHTELMRRFHEKGTFWTNIERIIETPLFVNSELTSMVQIADLCSYALRRYLENGETELFDIIMTRADRYRDKTVGVRHYTINSCNCKICEEH